jgi:uncharacterized cupin superfamily protein
MRRINLHAAELGYDDDDPDGYRAGLVRPGPQLGAKETGVSLYELPPGQSICPYHYEWAEEEWLVVLEGEPTLRDPDGEHALEAGDLAFFPIGPDGAHKITNRGDGTARVLMFSTVKHPAVSVYPDGDKIAVFTGGDRSDDIMVRRESGGVGYYEGEL